MTEKISCRSEITLMISVLLAMGIGGWVILRWALPQYWFPAYPFIPLIFIMFTVIIALLAVRWERGAASGRTTQQRVVVNLMGAKMGKFLLSLTLILIYWKIYEEQVNTFFVVFAIFYAVSLFMETLVSVKVTKKYNHK